MDQAADEDEGEGEDLLGENMYDDYKAIPELDTYESEGLSEGEHDDIAPDARLQAERLMRERDKELQRRQGRTPAALQDVSDEEEELVPPTKRRRGIAMDAAAEAGLDAGEAEVEDGYFNLEDVQAPLREWLSMERSRKEIRRRFAIFLGDYAHTDAKGNRTHPYVEAVRQMCISNKASFEVSWIHLSRHQPIIAIWVADAPELMLPLFDEEAMSFALTMFPKYEEIVKSVHVRISEVTILDRIRDLRQTHLNQLVRVEGVVTRRGPVYPQLQVVKYNCTKCRTSIGPFAVSSSSGEEVKPGRCPECQSAGPFVVNNSETVFQNYQKITLQETPGSVPAGRVPRQKEVILLHDLIDIAVPGDEVEVTGVYKHTYDTALNLQNGFPVFSTVIIANHIAKRGETLETFRLTEEDRREIEQLAKQPNIRDMIINSIAPSIYGHKDIKTALALCMFGGEPKELPKHRIRGDINCLILGDPGTAKSQFLKYAEKTAHRAVYTTGKGASAVGLTASVHTDPITREWTLEGGALVLADQGVCMIDEFDKMNDHDRTSIHEAMEQQSISISKAGIITSLKARCSVIAAANPVNGRYNESLTFAENVQLSDAILSRFDVLIVVKDEVKKEEDRRLASFVVDSHIRSHPSYEEEDEEVGESKQSAEGSEEDQANGSAVPAEAKPPISQAMLKKYIAYARQSCHPKMDASVDTDKLAKLYSELRRESLHTGGIPVAPRHLESIIRMAEAHAKMHLRNLVTDQDIAFASGVMIDSFIATQKHSVKEALRRHFRKYLPAPHEHFELLHHLLNQLVHNAFEFRRAHFNATAAAGSLLGRRGVGAGAGAGTERKGAEAALEEPVEVLVDDFRSKAAEYGLLDKVDSFMRSSLFTANKFKYDDARGLIVKRLH